MSNHESFPFRVGLQQRVLPAYRAPFFDQLAFRCTAGLMVFAGEALPEEAVQGAGGLQRARFDQASNLHLLRGRLYLCFQRGLMDWLEKWDPQILILEANPRYLSNLWAMRWMRNRGRPIIGWGLGGPSSWGGLRSTIWSDYLGRFDAMIAYSTHGAGRYLQAGMDRERVFIAYNAVTPAPEGDPPNREAPTPELHILFVGRLQDRKRIDLLLLAASRLEPKPSLTIVGDGPARIELEELADQIFPSAIFTGALHGERLDREFRDADLFVLPGTGGLAVQQAMAHGLPVMVAEGDGSQFDLVRPDTGWLLPSGDGEALLAALKEAASDPQSLRQMGIASYRLVQQTINIEAMADQFVKVMDFVWGAH